MQSKRPRGVLLLGALGCLLSACATLGGNDPQAREERARRSLQDAVEALNQRRGEKAFALARDAVEIAPCLAEARNLLGLLLFSQGKIREAKLQFEWAAHCKPEQALYHYNLALAHLFLNEPGFAIPELNRALEISPGEPRFRRALLTAQVMLKRWPEAEELARILNRVPEMAGNPYFQLEQSWISLARSAFAEALSFTERAEQRLQNPWLALATRGVILELMGNYLLAAQAYESALKYAPGNPHLYLIAGDLYHKLGFYGAAQKKLLQAVTLAEDSRTPTPLPEESLAFGYETLADTSYQLGMYATVPLYLREAQGRDKGVIPPDTAAHYSLGIRKFELRELDGAITEFEQAVSSSPRFALAWLRLSESYLDKALSLPLKERAPWITRAYEASRKVQDLAPKLPYGYYLEGKALVARSDLENDPIRRGTLRTALFAFSKAVQTGSPPDLLPGYEGALFMALGRYEEAAQALSAPVEGESLSYLVLWNRILAVLKSGRYRELPPLIEALQKAYPGDPDLKWFLPYLQAKRLLPSSPGEGTRP